MKKLILFLGFYLNISVWAIMAQPYSGGDGSPANPYLISTKADMIALSDAVKGGTTYSGKYFLLTNDITGPNNTITTVIGSFIDTSDNDIVFSGIFDGGNHEVEINNERGVFGWLQNATIRNLAVKGSISFSYFSGSSEAGGICAIARSSYVTNCSNMCNISVSSYPRISSAGGICGTATESSTIDNCYNLGKIIISSSSMSNSGGICGRLLSSSSISNCYNLGNITDNAAYSSGGICGFLGTSSTIFNCYNAGNISVSSSSYSSDYYSGGICGQIYEGNCVDRCFAVNSTITVLYGIYSQKGRITCSDENINTCFALSSMTVNGSTVSSTDANSKDGADATMSDFQSQSWIQNNLSWDFGTVWQMSSTSSVNQGLPVLKTQQQVTTYTITASAGSAGSISPSYNQTVIHGGSQTFTFTPNTGYEIEQALIDGENNPMAVSSGSYTFSEVTADHSIAVSFKQKQYTISVSAGNGGSISPSYNQTVIHGSSQTFTFTPNIGYEINQVLIDGVNNPEAVSSGSYTFSNVTSIQAISVSFKLASLPTFSGGSGSQSDPYRISSKTDMEYLVAAVEEGQIYSGKYFKLTTNLTGSNTLTTSVGSNSSSYFSGTFDGNGYEIELNNSQNGVFGYIQNATIQNLGVKGTIAITSTSNNSYIGGVCGYASNSTIIYCYNAATISGLISNNIYYNYIGGLCGSASGIISNSYNAGLVSVTADNYLYVGGICGSGGTILDCYNSGNVFSTISDSSPGLHGGICGAGSVKNCFSSGASIISKYNGGNTVNNTYIGRVMSYFSGNPDNISNNYALSTMTLNGSTVSSTDANGKDGADATMSNFQSQSWIQNNLGWDFSNVWQMSSTGSANQGLPILKYQQQPQSHTITASSGDNGSISPSGSVTVNHGSDQSFTFTPNSGYEIEQVLIDGSLVVSTNSYMFSNVTANHTISVTFKIKQYMVSASAGSGGSISPNGTVMINHGGSQTFYFYPNTGYEIEQVLIDGSLVVSTNSYTFSNVTENHTIFVSFSQLPVHTYTITASSGNNGSISPGGSVTVNHGSDQTFTFTPNPGCEIEQVLIDGESNSQAVSSGSYIFPNVTNNHSIAVSFRIQPISSYSGGDGSPGNPYLISTKADMVALSNAVQNGTTYAGNYFLLINDLVGANSLTTSIGTYDFNSFFQGIFDGGGHEIELNNAAGVFGYAVNATIRNLGVKGSVAFSMVTTAAAGGICGRATGTTISYCYNLGSISTSSPYSSSGGICGYSSSCVISNCYNLGNISASSPSYSYSGGICGYISSSSISNCYNLGNISASSFYPFAGGICGNSDKGSINNCFAANPVITAMNGNNNSADIGRISSHASSINNCHALSSMLVNGSEINSTDANGKDGNGVELSSLQAESWIAGNLGWDFSTVWTMSSGNSVNQGLPILKIVNCLPNLLVQVWNDVLSVINDPAKNGGYEFISYQWYRNGIDIPGEINGNLYLINGENDPDAQYAVRLITTDGQPIQSCPVRFSPAGNSVLRAYPNPAQKIITIAGEAIEDGDNVEIFDTNGQFICRFIATKNQTTLNISSFLKGTYIVKVNNKQVKIIKN